MWRPSKDSKDPAFVDHARTVFWYAFWFLVIALALIFVMYRFSSVRSGLSKINSALRSIWFGLLIAYLLSPIENLFLPLFARLFQKRRHKDSLAKGFSIATAIVIGIGFVVLLFALIVPGLLNSIETLISNFSTYEGNFMKFLESLDFKNPDLKNAILNFLTSAGNKLENWLSTTLSDDLSQVVSKVTSGIVSVVMFFFNLIVGFIISAYVLRDKQKIKNGFRKLCASLFAPKTADSLIGTAKTGHKIFGGFIYGKILDSLIIGVLCFIGMTILRIPYSLLVSVIVCLTNIIPFFGPFIGAIPSFFLILIVDPIKSLYFVVFILVLQQLDGNVIGPKILGDNLGINEFWVIFSLLLFGGIFGILGMILGAPLFALIYYLIVQGMNHRLKKKGMPVEVEAYSGVDKIETLAAANVPADVPADEAKAAPAPGEAPPAKGSAGRAAEEVSQAASEEAPKEATEEASSETSSETSKEDPT